MNEIRDPLRPARQAVRDGQFRHALENLQATDLAVRVSPEWLLLSAMARWRLGDFSRSRSLATQARDAFREHGDPDGEMHAENVRAAGSFALGDLDDAEHGFERSLELARYLGDELMAARCANNLGNVEHYRGNNIAARSRYSIAGAGFHRTGFLRGVYEARHNTSIAERELGNLSESRKASDEAVELAGRLGNRRLLAQALVVRAETIALSGDLELARAHARQGLELARSEEDRLTETDAHRVLSLISSLEGEVDTALQEAHTSVAVAREVEHSWMTAMALKQLGAVREARGDTTDARAAYREAEKLFRALGSTGKAREVGRRVENIEDHP